MVPLWLIIAAILVVILIIMFRTMNGVYLLSLIKKNFFWLFAVAFLIFVAYSATTIYLTYDLDFTTFEGLTSIGKIFFLWLKNLFVNLADVTGYATEHNWIPDASNVTQ